MRIEHVKITGFGRHDKVESALNAGVIGLAGPNGAGKSTVLTAIRYAFTGLLEEGQKADSYIRHFGAPHAAKKAVVEVGFSKHGVKGIITREILKGSTKRSLVWNGKPAIKGAAEVEDAITEIMAAPKAAVASAIFIPQGDLDKLLFGPQAEREKMFASLLLVGHLAKVADQVSLEIASLNSSIVDLTAVSDELDVQRRAAEDALTDARRQAKGLQPFTEELAILQRIDLAKKQLHSAQATMDARRHELDASTAATRLMVQQLNAYLESTCHASSVIEFRTIVERAQKSVHDLEVIQAKKVAVDNTTRDLEAARQALAEARNIVTQNEAMAAARDSLPELQAQIAIETQRPEQVAVVQRANTAMQNGAAALVTARAALAQLLSDADRQARLDDIQAHQNTRALVDLKLQVKRLVQKADSLACCPACERSLEGVAVVATEDLAELEKAARHAAARITELQNELTADSDKRAALDRTIAVQTQIVDDNCTLRNMADAWLAAHPAQDLHALQMTVNTITAAVHAHTSALSTVQQLNADIARRELELAGTPADVLAAIREFDPAAYQTSKAQLSLLQGQLQELERLDTAARSANTDAEVRERTFNASVLARDAAASEAAAQVGQLEGVRNIQALQQLAQDAGLDLAAYLTQQSAAYHSATGRLQEAEKVVEGVILRQKDLEARKALDANKREIVRELQLVKDTFSREALPMAYIRYRFEQLATLTQNNLVRLAAQIAVDVDPEVPVTFTFTRVDDPVPYVMKQDKLSGGQKVRLTVAFLMAVQQLILPEVGLLVLDEPSMHLDDDGKESLKTMLLDIGRMLGNTDMQVIVSDHEPKLEPAYGSIIRLR